MTTARPQNTTHARSFRVSTRFHSSVTAGSTGAVERWRASASRTTSVMSTIAAPRIVPPEQANLAQPRREREADQADHDRRHADASADDHPGAEGRGGK